MYSRSGQQAKKAQEPAITTAEKYIDCILTGNAAFVCTNLDPRILIQSPMGYFYGRPICKGWLAFECSVFTKFAEFLIVKDITSLDGMKVAKAEWSVGGLHFEDVFHINQLMQFRGITRTMTRNYSCQEDKDVAEAVLLALTGPYFAPHCGPRKIAANTSRIDNQALILPILDYTYKNLTSCTDILRSHPQGAKPVEDSAVAMHYMSDALERRKEQMRIRKQSQGINGKDQTANEFGRSEDKIAIKARNREGDQKVLFVDKADLNRTNKTSKGYATPTTPSQIRSISWSFQLCSKRLSSTLSISLPSWIYHPMPSPPSLTSASSPSLVFNSTEIKFQIGPRPRS